MSEEHKCTQCGEPWEDSGICNKCADPFRNRRGLLSREDLEEIRRTPVPFRDGLKTELDSWGKKD